VFILGLLDCVQSAAVVSRLALQRPLVVIEKLVDCVVQNKGYVDGIVKLLRLLPALCSLPLKDGHQSTDSPEPAQDGCCSAMLELVKLRMFRCTLKQVSNVVSFCHHLVVSAAENTLWSPALCLAVSRSVLVFEL